MITVIIMRELSQPYQFVNQLTRQLAQIKTQPTLLFHNHYTSAYYISETLPYHCILKQSLGKWLFILLKWAIHH